jgi:predicted Fe-S protein YdhL (DUF1289 family)
MEISDQQYINDLIEYGTLISTTKSWPFWQPPKKITSKNVASGLNLVFGEDGDLVMIGLILKDGAKVTIMPSSVSRWDNEVEKLRVHDPSTWFSWKWKTRYRPKPIKRTDFDQEALKEIARDKLAELEVLMKPSGEQQERREVIEWIMMANETYSHIWILALIWLYRHEEEREKLDKEGKKWNWLSTKNRIGQLSEDDIEVARQYPIENLVEDIRVVGGRMQALCPFHAEKTPSFVIYPDNSYYCFGCQAHGRDAIDFVRQRDNLRFREAVKQLL